MPCVYVEDTTGREEGHGWDTACLVVVGFPSLVAPRLWDRIWCLDGEQRLHQRVCVWRVIELSTKINIATNWSGDFWPSGILFPKRTFVKGATGRYTVGGRGDTAFIVDFLAVIVP